MLNINTITSRARMLYDTDDTSSDPLTHSIITAMCEAINAEQPVLQVSHSTSAGAGPYTFTRHTFGDASPISPVEKQPFLTAEMEQLNQLQKRLWGELNKSEPDAEVSARLRDAVHYLKSALMQLSYASVIKTK